MSNLLQVSVHKYACPCAVGKKLQIRGAQFEETIGDFFVGELFGKTPLDALSAPMPLAEMLAYLNLTSLHPLGDYSILLPGMNL